MAFNNNVIQTDTECTHPLASGGAVLDLIFMSEGITRSSYERILYAEMSDYLIASLVFSSSGYRPTSCVERDVSTVYNVFRVDDESITDELELS